MSVIRCGPLPISFLDGILSECGTSSILSGVRYLHEHDIVHRDLKRVVPGIFSRFRSDLPSDRRTSCIARAMHTQTS